MSDLTFAPPDLSQTADVMARAAANLHRALATVGVANPRTMLLGKEDGTVDVPPSKSEVGARLLAYVRRLDTKSINSSEPRMFAKAFNPHGFQQPGLPVIVGETYGRRYPVIVGVDYDRQIEFMMSSGVRGTHNEHGADHALFGAGGGKKADPVFVDERQIVNLAVVPNAPMDLNVTVKATPARTVYFASDNTPQVWDADVDVDLSGEVPGLAGRAVWVLLSLDVDAAPGAGALTATAGASFIADLTAFRVIEDCDSAKMPNLPAGETPLAMVYLIYAQTQIDWHHIRRPALRGGAGGAGGCATLKLNPTDLGGQTVTAGCSLTVCGPVTITGTFVNDGQVCIA